MVESVRIKVKAMGASNVPQSKQSALWKCTFLVQVVSAPLQGVSPVKEAQKAPNNYPSRLVVRTSDELKGAYLGLCKSRGVTASDEVRAYMAREIAKYTGRGVQADRNAQPREAASRQAENNEKCNKTADMFYGEKP